MAYLTAAAHPFREYVRSVFADQAARSRTLRAHRARWLRRLGQPPGNRAEQRWEGEGGSTVA